MVARATGWPAAWARAAFAVAPSTARPTSSTDGTSATPAAAWPLTFSRNATRAVLPPDDVDRVLFVTRRRIRLKVEPPGVEAGGGVEADGDAPGEDAAGAVAGVPGAVDEGDEGRREGLPVVSVPLPPRTTVRPAAPRAVGTVARPAGVGPSAEVATVMPAPPGPAATAVPRLAARSSGRATEGRRRAPWPAAAPGCWAPVPLSVPLRT